MDVNASAGLRRGLLSLFSHDLVLTIGLPLVQGLSLREFTAVLAHEFGHFRQGGGMERQPTEVTNSPRYWPFFRMRQGVPPKIFAWASREAPQASNVRL